MKRLCPPLLGSDRRLDRRYLVDLELRYSLSTPSGMREAGAGIARDLSRGGVLLEAGDSLAPGRPVELVIAWPFQLQGVCNLELVVTGETVRIDGIRAGVRADGYRFRTRGGRSFEEQPALRQRLLAMA